MPFYNASTVPEGSLFRLCHPDGRYVEGAFERRGNGYLMLEGDWTTGFSRHHVEFLPGEEKLVAQIISSPADLAREVALFPPTHTAKILKLPLPPRS